MDSPELIRNPNEEKINGGIDIVKFVMAVLVIGIHTKPFDFNALLNAGFGVVTRFCVPFFFVAGAYFFWVREKPLMRYLWRVILLYLLWTAIYIPYSLFDLMQTDIWVIVKRFLWDGSGHALWYLWATVIGTLITYLLLKILKPKYVLMIAVAVLIIGTLKSTYAPAVERLFGFRLPDFLGSRNGLYYGFPYIATGMFIAKTSRQGLIEKPRRLFLFSALSLTAYVGELLVFGFVFHAEDTILWLGVLPGTACLFLILLNFPILISKSVSLGFRRFSTLMYVSQFLFIPIFQLFGIGNILLFLLTCVCTIAFSALVIWLSRKKHLTFLRYLY